MLRPMTLVAMLLLYPSPGFAAEAEPGAECVARVLREQPITKSVYKAGHLVRESQTETAKASVLGYAFEEVGKSGTWQLMFIHVFPAAPSEKYTIQITPPTPFRMETVAIFDRSSPKNPLFAAFVEMEKTCNAFYRTGPGSSH